MQYDSGLVVVGTVVVIQVLINKVLTLSDFHFRNQNVLIIKKYTFYESSINLLPIQV